LTKRNDEERAQSPRTSDGQLWKEGGVVNAGVGEWGKETVGRREKYHAGTAVSLTWVLERDQGLEMGGELTLVGRKL